jgi:hypothetical protein
VGVSEMFHLQFEVVVVSVALPLFKAFFKQTTLKALLKLQASQPCPRKKEVLVVLLKRFERLRKRGANRIAKR